MIDLGFTKEETVCFLTTLHLIMALKVLSTLLLLVHLLLPWKAFLLLSNSRPLAAACIACKSLVQMASLIS
jgi:hypothetical protein